MGDLRADAAAWLGGPRPDPYLAACGGDLAAAMSLYAWNISLAQAVLHDVALFEVALRNACDRCLSSHWGGGWPLDEGSPVRRPIMRTNRRGNVRDQNLINRRAIDALARAGRGRDWIVSNLTLGFWAHMADRSHERDLWILALHRVWPEGSDRAEVFAAVSEVLAARNRAVHHERLFSPAPAARRPPPRRAEQSTPSQMKGAPSEFLSEGAPVVSRLR